jgi:hypothetical protein
MNLYVTEYCKLDKVENGMASGTFCVPVELCDEIMLIASSLINGTRILKMKSKMLSAQAKGESAANLHQKGTKNK